VTHLAPDIFRCSWSFLGNPWKLLLSCCNSRFGLAKVAGRRAWRLCLKISAAIQPRKLGTCDVMLCYVVLCYACMYTLCQYLQHSSVWHALFFRHSCIRNHPANHLFGDSTQARLARATGQHLMEVAATDGNNGHP